MNNSEKLQKFLDSGSQFIIVYWEKNIWKTDFMLDFLSKKNDYEILKILWKTSIKIDENENIDWEQKLGTSQIQNFFQTTSFKKWKIIFIENIERLSDSAAQAFLKTLEEPGENNFILATSSTILSLPATIASRASILSFQNDFSSENFLTQNSIFDTFLIDFTGRRKKIAEKLVSDGEFLETIKSLKNLSSQDLATRQKIFKTLHKNNILETAVLGLARVYEKEGQFEKWEKILLGLKMLADSVNLESVLFFLALNAG